jgi:gliding motility-associated-like protein
MGIRFQSVFIAVFILLALPLRAQLTVPSKCFEIESILVDACVSGGTCSNASSPACSCEGKNEMVRFRVGNAPLQLSGINITWPNNTFQGLVQNALTASLTSTLNAGIQSCGILLEPPGGIIPAGSQVLLITSTDMCTSSNSFAALSDTLYIIFQNAGNFAGHFANTNNSNTISSTPSGPSNTRTLIMRYTPASCSDTVVYDRSLLVNNLGTYGGSALQNDGSTVLFSWPGAPVATYVNNGCQAAFVPLAINSVNGNGTFCNTSPVGLSASITGSAVGTFWTGGTGTFTTVNQLSAVYNPGIGETGNVTLFFNAISGCGDTVSSPVNITLLASPQAQITASGPLTLCGNDSLILTASGGTSFLWNTAAVTASITVNAAGTYLVAVSNSCGTDTQSVQVAAFPLPAAQITAGGPLTICTGDSVLLTASGGSSYLWNNSSTSASVWAALPGVYTVTASNGCGSDTAQVTVIVVSAVTALVSPAGPLSLCPGDSVLLTASGGNSYLWSNSAVTPAIWITQPGSYVVSVTGNCGSDTASVVIGSSSLPAVQITPSTTQALCPGDSLLLTASGNGAFTWSTGGTNASIYVTAAGSYSVIATNACGTASASLNVQAGVLPAASVSGNTLICNGDSTTLTVSGTGSFIWNTGSTSSSIIVNTPGIYSVIASNTCGSDTAQLSVSVSQATALFSASVIQGNAPLSVNFTDGSASNTVSWNWDFGNGNTSTSPSPGFVYNSPGTYNVSLTVINAQGCTDVYTLTIVVTDNPSSLQMPNVFTPNGDGVNDIFLPQAESIATFNMYIYDRWGVEVAHIEQINRGWDGRNVSGIEVSDGTYYYVVRASGYDAKVYELTGFLTLLRN